MTSLLPILKFIYISFSTEGNLSICKSMLHKIYLCTTEQIDLKINFKLS